MNVARFAVKNPVLVNILMAAILVLGGFSLLELPQELARALGDELGLARGARGEQQREQGVGVPGGRAGGGSAGS